MTSEIAVALYDYAARRPIEISFSKGDTITIVSRTGAWWIGELNGSRGKFPSNYVKLQEAPAPQEPVEEPPKEPEATPASSAAPPPAPRPTTTTTTKEPEKAPPPAPRPTTTTTTKEPEKAPPPAPRPTTAEKPKEPEKAPPPAPRPTTTTTTKEPEKAPPPAPRPTTTTTTKEPETTVVAAPAKASEAQEPLQQTCVALYDYRAQRDVELSFKKGSVIAVISARGKWWEGELDGVRGRIPSNYVKLQTSPAPAPAPAAATTPAHQPQPTAQPAAPAKPQEAHQKAAAPTETEPTKPAETGEKKHKHKHRHEKHEKSHHQRHASSDSKAAPPATAADGTIKLGAPPPPPPSGPAPPPPSSTGETAAKPQTRSRSLSSGGTTPPPLALGKLATPAASSSLPPATFDGRRTASMVPKGRDIRYATVRLPRGATTFGGVGESADGGVSEDYMAMMKWTAEYVPNLTRSLFQDPSAPKAAAAVANDDYIPPPPTPPPPVDGKAPHRYNIFSEPDTPANVRLNPTTGQLVAGTLPKIVGRLTDKDAPGRDLIQAFLLTFRSFAEPMIVLDLLSTRFDTPPELDDQLQEAIQIRVWFLLKEWVTTMIDDFVESGDLSVKLSNLIERMCGSPRDSVSQASSQLRMLFRQKLASAATSSPAAPPFGAPKPIPPSGPIRHILDVSPVELARQLSLIKFDTFRKIKPKELCNLSWTKKDATLRAPNLVRLIRDFNKTGQWITGTILAETDLAQRIKVLKHVLAVAEECRTLQNFQSMMEIVAALESAPISRLRKMWSSKITERLKALGKLMDKNFRELRMILQTASPPCVPYLGLYFTDLVFIEEGNTNYLRDAPNMVNWTKALMSANVLLQIQRFQQKGFILFEQLQVHEWLVGTITNVSMTEQQAYQRSLEIEPRESK